MKALSFRQQPESETGMVRVLIVKKGMFRMVAELPTETYSTICEIADASNGDPVDHIYRMAMRYYSGTPEIPSKNKRKSSRLSI